VHLKTRSEHARPVFRAGMRSQRHGRCELVTSGLHAAEAADQLITIHLRHFNIVDQHVERLRDERLQRGAGGVRLCDPSPIMTFLSIDRLIHVISLEFEFSVMRRWPGLLARHGGDGPGFPANRSAIAVSAFQEIAMDHEIGKEDHFPFDICHCP
jgi:hypothetical protein